MLNNNDNYRYNVDRFSLNYYGNGNSGNVNSNSSNGVNKGRKSNIIMKDYH